MREKKSGGRGDDKREYLLSGHIDSVIDLYSVAVVNRRSPSSSVDPYRTYST